MAHTIYENSVLANKIHDILATKVDINPYMTVDTSLSQTAGMKKVINVYTATGSVEELDMGEGNTGDIEVSFTPVEYEVKTYQGKFEYFDEQEMTDPMVVDAGLDGLSKTMINKFNELAIAEYGNATLKVAAEAWGFDAVVDALALFGEDEAEFILINPASKAAFRKALKDDLSYSEGFVRTGYIGSVCGVPVVVSNIVPEGKAYVAKKEAVTLFIKKDTEVEQERDADLRKNSVFGRKVAVVALTDATKVVEITVGATTEPEVPDEGSEEEEPTVPDEPTVE